MADQALEGVDSLTIASIFDQTALPQAVPGGGSVSAVCGYLAVALLLKCVRIAARAHADEATIRNAEEKLLSLAEELLECAKADAGSYAGYMQARRMPKTSPDEIALRQQAMRDGAIDACVSALKILERGNQILGVANNVRNLLNPSTVADHKSAVALLSAMNQSAAWNADANLEGVDDTAELMAQLAKGAETHTDLLAACLSG